VAAHAGLPGIILHGTTTLAPAVGVVVDDALGGDPERVERVAARFTAMIPLPSQIRVRILSAQRGGSVRFDVLNGEGRVSAARWSRRSARVIFPLHPGGTPMSAPFNLSETDRLLSTTRAVRKRLDLKRPVERNVILDCIRLSQQAPTGSNSQSWRWMVVTDKAKRAELARLYKEVGDQYLEMARNNVPAGDAQTKRVYDSAFWLKDHLHEVPVHVIPCVVGRLPENAPVGMHAAVFGSIFPAIWSFQLALRSRGLGSALTTLHLFREQEAAKLLGIPENVMQVALLPVGYTQGTDFKISKRPAPETITSFDTWSV
jgi:nitroreductase